MQSSMTSCKIHEKSDKGDASQFLTSLDLTPSAIRLKSLTGEVIIPLVAPVYGWDILGSK